MSGPMIWGVKEKIDPEVALRKRYGAEFHLVAIVRS